MTGFEKNHLLHQVYIEEVERVRQRAARWVKVDYRMTSSVTVMLNDLKWSTLQKHHHESSLTTLNAA